MLKKCKITRYDESITEPPYEFIYLDEIEVDKPDQDHLGEEFYRILRDGCRDKGYTFKFYTMCSNDKNYDYQIVVY